MSRQDRMARKAWRAALHCWPGLACHRILRRLCRHARTAYPGVRHG